MYLLRVEHVPSLTMVQQKEFVDMLHLLEVDESVPHITFVLYMVCIYICYSEINGQVKEIILIIKVLVHIFQDQGLGIFIRNISNHQGSSSILFHLNHNQHDSYTVSKWI